MTHESKSPVQLVVGAIVVLCAASCFAMDITTSDGKTYHDVTIMRAEADGLVITHSGGAGKVPFLELPKDIREKYGYDPAKAEAARAKAEASKKAAASAWQDMDQRMVFFTVQLSSVEASIAAINRALTMLGYQQSNRKFDANTARQANTTMDRYGGGPVQWEEFYGRTAEKFFYHPTDRNTSYHTQTVLGQKPPEWDNATGPGVPSRQGLPVHQRPPQFDYIYRGNSDAEKRAMEEVARIGNNVEALLQRRRQLEAEQSALWSKIAFHAVTSRELLNKPLYYCDLTSVEPGEGRARVEAMRAAMDYLRNANKLAAMVEQGVEADAARCYSQLQEGAAAARGEMERRLMAQPAASGEMADRQTALGQLTAVAKRMNEITANIADAYRLALDGDQAGDQGRKLTFRSQLQQSLMLCAEALLAGDECVNDLAKEWKVSPAKQTTAPASTTVQASLAAPPQRPVETPRPVVSPKPAEPQKPVETPKIPGDMKGAAISISCSAEVRILPLEPGQLRVYTLSRSKFENVIPELSGWQFTSIPRHFNSSYEIRVNQDGVLYAFGWGSKGRLGTDDISKWEAADGAITGGGVNYCFRRKVAASEIIELHGRELQIAAKSIELVSDGKSEPATQSATPTPTPAAVAPQPGQAWPSFEILAKDSPSSIQDLFSPEFAALPSDMQFNRVVAKLKELNPEFKGDISCKKNGNAIREIQIRDGLLGNLWPLRALQFESLRCCGGGDVSDLSPLKGMPLTALFLPCCAHLSDLSALQGMPLRTLFVNGTQVRDLSPLCGMPVVMLSFKGTFVTDLAPLKTMPNLRHVVCDFAPDRDGALLRSIKTLEQINHIPVQEFWKRVDAGEAPQP